MDSPEILKNMLRRERKARKQAEAIMEQKSLEVYLANQDLTHLNESLEERILERTKQIEAKNEDLRIAKEKAEAATVAKSEFLSNMSHEIRTPLNAIMGMIELIIEDSEDQLAVKHASSVKYSAENLLKIINGILDFSKIEAGKITFEKIPFRLDRLVQGIKDIFQHKADDKGLDFIIEIDPDVPLNLEGDRVKLNQILINLIGNAFKFTETGYVRTEIKLVKKIQHNCRLQFAVIDSGIGIPKSKHRTVFESFSQANNSTTRLYGGTGLGLAITKGLIELQNGSISLESEPGQGTTFFVELPFDYTLESKIKTTPKEDIKQDFSLLEDIKVLVVEDIAVNRLFMKQVFKRKKIPADFAVNGHEAIKQLSTQKYDMVFMDLHMPVMDGYQATKIIRDPDSPVKDHLIPIIALTADAFEETKNEVLELGMDGFLSKPIDIHKLYDTIMELMADR